MFTVQQLTKKFIQKVSVKTYRVACRANSLKADADENGSGTLQAIMLVLVVLVLGS
jgi:hypothetical protein